jgi:hypothetical protein
MIEAIVALAIIVALLLFQRERENIRGVTRERAWERERKSLLDRIQFPERVQVEAGPYEPVEPPIDAAELAYVGQEVPEFLSVGSDESHRP